MPRHLIRNSLALVVLLIGVVWIRQYLWRGAGESHVMVMVAARYIPMGTRIEEADVNLSDVLRAALQPGVLASKEDIIGMVGLAPIAKGEQILANKIAKAPWSLSAVVPLGKRAVGVMVDHATSIGVLEPGDWVDVLLTLDHTEREGSKQASYTVTLVQNVQVIAVGQRFRPLSKEKESLSAPPDRLDLTPSVHVALTPEESELIAYGEARGRLKLILRGPGDKQVTSSKLVNFTTILKSFKSMTKPSASSTLSSPQIIPGLD